MVRKFATGALFALSALWVAAPAQAQTTTFDAFTSFNATQGAGGFSFGTYNGTSFTPFTQNTGCVIPAVTCLRGAGANLPSVFKADGSAATSGTVILSPDRLIGHPGQGDESLYIAFAAPFAGNYRYSASFNQQDTNAAQNSILIQEFNRTAALGDEFFDVGVVDQNQPEILTGFSLDLQAGDVVGYIINNNGSFLFDSTGFNFTVETDDLAPTPAVPEPASWAMMIMGIGVVGGAMRRRPAAKTATA